MNIQLAKDKSQQLGISTIQIVREEYEMILLSHLFNSQIGAQIVFKGGTALRLAYQSPRFSDDLDFSILKEIDESNFINICTQITNSNPNLELKEALKKYYTLFALYKIKDPVLTNTISIKLEISTRKESWIKNSDYLLLNLKSDVTPINTLAQVSSLNRIRQEKLNINPKRIRDIFDLWYIEQQLGISSPMDFKPYTNTEIKRDLYKLLSLNTRKLIDPWLNQQ